LSSTHSLIIIINNYTWIFIFCIQTLIWQLSPMLIHKSRNYCDHFWRSSMQVRRFDSCNSNIFPQNTGRYFYLFLKLSKLGNSPFAHITSSFSKLSHLVIRLYLQPFFWNLKILLFLCFYTLRNNTILPLTFLFDRTTPPTPSSQLHCHSLSDWRPPTPPTYSYCISLY